MSSKYAQRHRDAAHTLLAVLPALIPRDLSFSIAFERLNIYELEDGSVEIPHTLRASLRLL